jgi:hypothetical protein
MSIPALIISINALKVADQQRLDALKANQQQRADAQQQFAQRVSVPERHEFQILQSRTLSISNSNTLPAVMRIYIFTYREFLDDGKAFLYDLTVPACTDGDFELDLPQEDLNDALVETDIRVHNPIDGRQWTLSDPGFPAVPSDSREDPRFENARAMRDIGPPFEKRRVSQCV